MCGGVFVDRPPREHAANACTDMYRCGDGRWFMLTMLNEERQFAPLLGALERSDLLDDPRFATLPARRENSRALTTIFDDAFAARDLAEWRVRLDRAGITFGIVGTLDDMLDDPQMRTIEALVPFADDDLLTVSSAFQIAGERKVRPRRSPEVGQHSDEVLREAGYSPDEIARLREPEGAGLVGVAGWAKPAGRWLPAAARTGQ